MKNLSSVILLLLLVSACDNLLVEDPRGLVSPEQMFNTAGQAESVINGLYEPLYSEYSSGLASNMPIGTDLWRSRQYWNGWMDYTMTAGDVPIEGYWRRNYEGVAATNMAIDGVTKSDLRNEVKDRLVGEAKFLRAHYYFTLSYLFGGVPLWTEETTISEAATLPRASLQEVRAQVIEDLIDAESKLPVSYTGKDVGRATQGAARALLTKVYLYNEQWADARDEAQKIVNSGAHRLLSEYADVFKEENENNDETIFSVQFERDVKRTLNCRRMEPRPGDYEGPSGVFTGWNSMFPTMMFTESFAENDQRKDQIVITEWEGHKLAGPRSGPKFFDLDAPGANCGKNFVILRYADVLLMLAEAENELSGPTPAAYDAINQVRDRAGLEPLSGLSQEEFRDAIFWERAWELAGEGQRRFDLNRWNRLVEAVKMTEDELPFAAANVQPHHVLFPIPPNEIIKNPNLTQNPGY